MVGSDNNLSTRTNKNGVIKRTFPTKLEEAMAKLVSVIFWAEAKDNYD